MAEAVLKASETISAGGSAPPASAPSVFAHPPFPPPAPSGGVSGPAAPLRVAPRTLASVLFAAGQPVFAILDAAQEQTIPSLLEKSGETYVSLYQGNSARDLASVAPYLVRVPEKSRLFELLAKEGWGKNWAVYLTCGSALEDVRKQLRTNLAAKTPDGESCYFRFYDPRVLRAFLPLCTPAEAAQFFGPVTRYIAEGEDPKIALEFMKSSRGVSQVAVPVLRPPSG